MENASTQAGSGRLPSDPADLDPRVRAFRLILLNSQRLRGLMDDHLRPSGLTTQQATVMSLVESLGQTQMTTLSARMGTSHQNVRQIVDALVRKGLLEVAFDVEDRRRRMVRLTAEAGDFWAQRSAADFDVVASWFADLDDVEAETLVVLLGRLLAAAST